MASSRRDPAALGKRGPLPHPYGSDRPWVRWGSSAQDQPGLALRRAWSRSRRGVSIPALMSVIVGGRVPHHRLAERGPIDPGSDYKEWRRLLEAAGVRRARLHDARHTAASLLLAQGVPARVVMEILGHSQITLTLGTYSHVAPELQQEAAERMGRVL